MLSVIGWLMLGLGALIVVRLGLGMGDFKFGDARLRRFTATASTAINTGVICYQDTSTKKILPAASFTWDTNIGTTQTNFHPFFAGINQERRRSDQTDTNEILIATGGVFEFTIAAPGSALPTGTLVGPAKQSGNALENTKVVSVSNEYQAVGQLARPCGAADTICLVEIFSTLVNGGVQVAAAAS